MSSWKSWRAATGFPDGEIDLASRRLLPLLYRALAGEGVDDGCMSTLKQSYRQTWMSNQLFFAELRKALRILADAGIDVLLLKGAALSELYYGDEGVRPMGDLDVAVRREHAEAAIDALRSAGWQPVVPDALEFDLAFRHGCPLRSREDVELDVHWHVLTDFCQSEVDRDFWSRARRIEGWGAPAWTLDPTDALLHTLVHGTRWNPVSPIRWVADAAAILGGSGGSLDWQRLVGQVRDGRFRIRAGAALDYLRRTFGLAVPSDVVPAVGIAGAAWFERAEYRCLGSPESWSGVNLGSLFLGAAHCARATSDRPAAERFAYLARYMWARGRGKRVLRRLLSDPVAALRPPPRR